MEEQPQQPGTEEKYQLPVPENLPNATTVLVLGILSIVFSFWYFSIIGIILGIITLVLANKDMQLYAADKKRYSLNSFNNLKAGRTCAIIGLVVAIIIFIIVLLVILGFLASIPFWGMID
jgi:magnesium-transporting ATPase (P-type)